MGLTLTTEYTIKIRLKKLLGGIPKGVTDLGKCKDDFHVSPKVKKYVNGYERPYIHTHIHIYIITYLYKYFIYICVYVIGL